MKTLKDGSKVARQCNFQLFDTCIEAITKWPPVDTQRVSKYRQVIFMIAGPDINIFQKFDG